MKINHRHLFYILVLNIFGVCLLSAKNLEVKSAQGKMREWVQLQHMISQEKQKWEIEKAALSHTQSLMQEQLEVLGNKLSELEALETSVDREREKWAEEKVEYANIEQSVGLRLDKIESSLQRLFVYFPEPLMKKIEPLQIRLMPRGNNDSIPPTQRLQAIIGILNEANQFNNTVTFSTEVRRVKAGNERLVKVLYWGLAGSYFIDASETYAGVGRPTQEGWQYTSVEDAAPQIAQLFKIHAREEEAAFIALPAQIQ